MLNGKFYTGLTAGQLSRTRASGAPDRLKSSFFWPDETDSQPSTQNRRSAARVRQTPASAPPATAAAAAAAARTSAERDVDVKPKELFHKQLTSKIEFNDDLKATTPKSRRRNAVGAPVRTQRIADIATSQDLTDIARSIEKPTAAVPMRDRSTNRREPNNSRQPTKTTPVAVTTTRRKITFDEPPKRGILKNNELMRAKRPDYEVDPIPVYKKNNVTRQQSINRLQLSKSMDNFARLDIGETKRNNVEHERQRAAAAQEAAAAAAEEEEDYPEREYFEKWGNEYEDTSTTHNGNRSYAEESRHEESYAVNRDGAHEQRRRNERTVVRHHIEHNNDDAEVAGVVGRQHRHPNQYHHSNSKAADDVIGYAKHYADVKQAPPPPQQQQQQQQQRAAQPDVTVVVQAAAGRRCYPNEAAVRAQSHLRSNIFFNDDGGGHEAAHGAVDRPRSVRESAVARVGVGLPNI